MRSRTIPIPPSPYGEVSEICLNSKNAKDFKVKGFPGTPHNLFPFTQPFKAPREAQRKGIECREDGHCLQAFEFDIKAAEIRTYDESVPACKTRPATR